jgi:hypothetical protein
MLCHSLLFNIGIKEAEPHLVKQLLYSGIVKAACHPPPNSAAGEMESGLRPYENLKRALSISAPSSAVNKLECLMSDAQLRLQVRSGQV